MVLQELRRTVFLPIALALTILLIGVLIAIFAPWQFMNAILVFIGITLFLYLIWSTRQASWRLRLLAIIIAIPAVIGISFGLVNGRAVDAVIGLMITLFFLVLLRFFQIPASYRLAYRRFRDGDMEEALRLVNKSIDARPDFWESYQLRALIYLADMNFGHAERDAAKALEIKPDAHPVYNSLGHILLAQERFAEAEEAYSQALDLAPGYALYLYHLGLSEFRQEKYQDAAESFAAATQGRLPIVEYELNNAYYLARSLEALGDERRKKVADAQILTHSYGLELLQEQLESQPDYPHLPRMKADLADMEARINALKAKRDAAAADRVS